jgi:pimeloyl-ACP methyl ester carboxylesterase
MSRLQEWWAEGHFIEVDGRRIFTRVTGTGPTLVFLHGFPTSSHDWAEVIADLSADFRCVTFDHLGYGASDKPPDADYSSIVQTDRALNILQSLGVTGATVIGHDLGGILLQQFLHRALHGQGASLEIEQAIFSNSSVYPKLYRPTSTQLALVDPAQGKLLARKITRDTLAASMMRIFPAHPPTSDRIDDLWAAISRNDGQHLWPDQLIYMKERADLGEGWVDAMRRTNKPLGFIYGLADPISGEHILNEVETDLPDARCIGLAGLGHYPQIESAQEFSAALRALLQQTARVT